ncbi:MAG: (2Fe-2S)-binding protein [Spirochaetia bacterium]
MKKITVNMKVNGIDRKFTVLPNTRLLDVLREELGLLGAKEGCGIGECGACTVLLNDKKVNSCLILAGQAEGASIVTIEGLNGTDGQKIHPLQQAFIDCGAVQCGYCTPGMIMSALELILENPNPSREEIIKAIEGNICRCGAYEHIIEAIQQASSRITAGNHT